MWHFLTRSPLSPLTAILELRINHGKSCASCDCINYRKFLIATLNALDHVHNPEVRHTCETDSCIIICLPSDKLICAVPHAVCFESLCFWIIYLNHPLNNIFDMSNWSGIVMGHGNRCSWHKVTIFVLIRFDSFVPFNHAEHLIWAVSRWDVLRSVRKIFIASGKTIRNAWPSRLHYIFTFVQSSMKTKRKLNCQYFMSASQSLFFVRWFTLCSSEDFTLELLGVYFSFGLLRT